MSNTKKKGDIQRHKIIIVENLATGEMTVESTIKRQEGDFNNLSTGQQLALAVTRGLENPEILTKMMQNLKDVLKSEDAAYRAEVKH